MKTISELATELSVSKMTISRAIKTLGFDLSKQNTANYRFLINADQEQEIINFLIKKGTFTHIQDATRCNNSQQDATEDATRCNNSQQDATKDATRCNNSQQDATTCNKMQQTEESTNYSQNEVPHRDYRESAEQTISKDIQTDYIDFLKDQIKRKDEQIAELNIQIKEQARTNAELLRNQQLICMSTLQIGMKETETDKEDIVQYNTETDINQNETDVAETPQQSATECNINTTEEQQTESAKQKKGFFSWLKGGKNKTNS